MRELRALSHEGGRSVPTASTDGRARVVAELRASVLSGTRSLRGIGGSDKMLSFPTTFRSAAGSTLGRRHASIGGCSLRGGMFGGAEVRGRQAIEIDLE